MIKGLFTLSLLSVASQAAEATGYKATGASIERASSEIYVGWTEESATKLIEKVDNTFTLYVNTWEKESAEEAEVMTCYKDGKTTNMCVVHQLSELDQAKAKLKMFVYTATTIPTFTAGDKPTTILAGTSQVGGGEMDVNLTVANPNGTAELQLGTEYQLVKPKSWGTSKSFQARYHKENTKADQAAVTAGVDAIKSGVAKTMTGIYYNNGKSLTQSAFKEIQLVEVGATAISIAVATASASFLFF